MNRALVLSVLFVAAFALSATATPYVMSTNLEDNLDYLPDNVTNTSTYFGVTNTSYLPNVGPKTVTAAQAYTLLHQPYIAFQGGYAIETERVYLFAHTTYDSSLQAYVAGNAKTGYEMTFSNGLPAGSYLVSFLGENYTLNYSTWNNPVYLSRVSDATTVTLRNGQEISGSYGVSRNWKSILINDGLGRLSKVQLYNDVDQTYKVPVSPNLLAGESIQIIQNLGNLRFTYDGLSDASHARYTLNSVPAAGGDLPANNTNGTDGNYTLRVGEFAQSYLRYRVELRDISSINGNIRMTLFLYGPDDSGDAFPGILLKQLTVSPWDYTLQEHLRIQTYDAFPGSYGQEAYARIGVFSLGGDSHEEGISSLQVGGSGFTRYNYRAQLVDISGFGYGTENPPRAIFSVYSAAGTLLGSVTLEPGQSRAFYASPSSTVGIEVTALYTHPGAFAQEAFVVTKVKTVTRVVGGGGSPMMVAAAKLPIQQAGAVGYVLAADVVNDLENEVQGLSPAQQPVYKQYIAQLKSKISTAPKDVVRAAQVVRADVADLVKSRKDAALGFGLTAAFAVAAASAWFFHDKRKKKMSGSHSGRSYNHKRSRR